MSQFESNGPAKVRINGTEFAVINWKAEDCDVLACEPGCECCVCQCIAASIPVTLTLTFTTDPWDCPYYVPPKPYPWHWSRVWERFLSQLVEESPVRHLSAYTHRWWPN